MTVTIKKNVDVQGTLEANQVKYQVKRDLSGDVQFENMKNTPAAGTFLWGSGWENQTSTTVTNNGWNFTKAANLKLKLWAWAYTVHTMAAPVTIWVRGQGTWQINSSTRNSTSTSLSSAGSHSLSTSTTITAPAGAGVTIAQSAPNVLTNRAALSFSYMGTIGSAYLTVQNTVRGQKNQKITIMK